MIELLLTIKLVVAAFMVIALGAFWYSMANKGWFHLLIKKIINEKCLGILFVFGIVAMFFCKIDNLKYGVDWGNGYPDAINDIIFSIAGGYVSGYIVYVLSNLVPYSKRQRPILRIVKERLWNTICEMEDDFSVIYGKRTLNTNTIDDFLLALASEKNEYHYKIKACNSNFILKCMGHVSITLDSVIPHIEYIDELDLEQISNIIQNTTDVMTVLNMSDGKDSFLDDKGIRKLSMNILKVYEGICQYHSKLENIV